MSGTVHIFSNGFEFECWSAANCDRCTKEPTCTLLRGDGGIVDSFIDGLFTQKAADRMGYRPELSNTLGWPCAEFSDEPPVRAPWPKPAAHVMRDAGAPTLPGLEPIS